MRKSTNIADISGSFDRGMYFVIPLDRSNPDEEFGAYLRYLECKGAEIFRFPCSLSVRKMRYSCIPRKSSNVDRSMMYYTLLDVPYQVEDVALLLEIFILRMLKYSRNIGFLVFFRVFLRLTP